MYSAYIGQKIHDYKATAKGPRLKIANDHDMAKYIEEEIASKKSPEVVADAISKDDTRKIKLCFRTIYNYIDKHIFNVMRDDLTYGKYTAKTAMKREESVVRKLSKKGRTIHDRPQEVETREVANHWEMDTVEGKKGAGEPVLLVLSERSSCNEIIRLMTGKTQDEVRTALDRIERALGAKQFREKFKTITSDNGSEFLDFESIEKSCINKTLPRTKLYYADAYAPWQRGTNENINKMIRRFLPKGKSLKDLTHFELQLIENWINNYPRKKFAFKTSNEVYYQNLIA